MGVTPWRFESSRAHWVRAGSGRRTWLWTTVKRVRVPSYPLSILQTCTTTPLSPFTFCVRVCFAALGAPALARGVATIGAVGDRPPLVFLGFDLVALTAEHLALRQLFGSTGLAPRPYAVGDFLRRVNVIDLEVGRGSTLHTGAVHTQPGFTTATYKLTLVLPLGLRIFVRHRV